MSTETTAVPPMIYEAMVNVMRDVEAIGKGQRNQTQGFAYRGIDDVYNALNGVLAKHGVFTTSEILQHDREERTNQKGTVIAFTILKIRYYFHAKDGSCIPSEVIGEGMDSGDKSSNKGMSIAHKYALLQAFCIPTKETDDPDRESHEVRGRDGIPIQTGGHPVGTQAAANYVRDKKLEQIRNEEHTRPAEGGEQAQPARPDTAGPVKAEGSSAPVSNHAPSTPTPSTAGHNIHPQHDTRGVPRPVAPAGIDVADASANGTTVKSPTPPPAGSVRHVPEALQPLLKQMGKSPSEQKALIERCHELLVKFFGEEDGDRRYQDALARNGAQQLSDVHLLSVARKIVIELYPQIEPFLEGVPA